jgi:hypothetical protein
MTNINCDTIEKKKYYKIFYWNLLTVDDKSFFFRKNKIIKIITKYILD